MKAKHIPTYVGLVAGTVLTTVATQAQAATFSTFDFDTNKTGNDSKRVITLNSVEFDGHVVTNPILVSGVENFDNTYRTPDAPGASISTMNRNNTGAASAEVGDKVKVNEGNGIKVEDPTAADIATALGNRNLNSIVDTEDNGRFTMDIIFSRAANHFFFWERGMNSSLKIQALGGAGEVLDTFVLNKNNVSDAGYSIDTTEIDGNQKVGSLGLKLNGAFTNKLRLIAEGSSYNGPDFKVAAASVPEPATVVGLSAAAAAMIAARRRKAAQG